MSSSGQDAILNFSGSKRVDHCDRFWRELFEYWRDVCDLVIGIVVGAFYVLCLSKGTETEMLNCLEMESLRMSSSRHVIILVNNCGRNMCEVE